MIKGVMLCFLVLAVQLGILAYVDKRTATPELRHGESTARELRRDDDEPPLAS